MDLSGNNEKKDGPEKVSKGNDKRDKSYDFEIVNEDYKTKNADEIEKDQKIKEEDDKDKKKKKKSKRKDKKRGDSEEDPGPSKKVKTSVLDNKNIPEDLREKYYEIEKNPLAVAIGNIPYGVSKNELLTYFTTLITSLKPDIANPIRNIEIGATNNFAIMDLDSKEMRDYVLELENLEFKGYKLAIQKVKGFFNKIYDAEAEGRDPFGNISTNALNEETKLYVGGLPLYLKDEDIRKLCEAFGFLKNFNLVKDNEGNHKGYCFVEYLDPKSTDKALKGLEGLEIGDRKIRAQKATTITAPKLAVQQTAASGAKPTNASGSFLLGFPNISDLSVQSMLNTPFAAKTPSTVVQISNLCTIEDLLEDDFYNDLMEDIKEEAEKFGPVEEVVIPRPDPKTGIVGPSVGKVFIKYKLLIPAKQARHRLSGRTYNRRTVLTAFYPEDKFETREYLTNPL